MSIATDENEIAEIWANEERRKAEEEERIKEAERKRKEDERRKEEEAERLKKEAERKRREEEKEKVRFSMAAILWFLVTVAYEKRNERGIFKLLCCNLLSSLQRFRLRPGVIRHVLVYPQ